MLRRLVIAALLAAAGLSATPAHANLCVYASGENDDTPHLPYGIVAPYKICVVVPIDPPPGG